ncbi:hypothetical protein J6TS1_23750 [Siminovitchia terrae]|uniref:Uncharacterized protein n=1 Tax=Siminovitchia terrae TaxID=1914933 RepID=A0A429X0B7_SIMTE|nr:hypothetical protein [Siminovitchia terrae]RST56906.1 hypothetical protein D5F11_025605 [Siminovitchia terrae]GIN92059.1 hypothetical protein J22TS1_31100 [Siminovitchia terrae]GIN96505.1 hypothetical protein J6TS1_23750 [Siminovitchia terrae]
MKKYFVFLFCLSLLYMAFQILSGAIATALYTPDFYTIKGSLSQTVEFGEVNSMPLLETLLIGTMAYLLSQKFKPAKN